ncbi:hypothetical protein C8F04DRAFT_1263418 [Mycena alexandri]|uniref:Uncharacterized protein n=1 Tax=Mycena alexandri TaxID=1745969 RepID=A0AAD6SND1_9AGAR|nr:hypothetical protein C8F04DRAFT_1263418 [Mycena alexandri]
MFWNPQREDFISPESGMTITRGLGKLRHRQCSRLADAVKILLEECRNYTETIPAVARVFSMLEQSLKLGLERLQSVPSTYQRMVLEVTIVQRTYLELKGLLEYMTIYKNFVFLGSLDDLFDHFRVLAGCLIFERRKRRLRKTSLVPSSE